MVNKKVNNLLRIGIYWLLGLIFLWGGILYARFEKGWLAETLPKGLRSQVIKEETLPSKPLPTMSREKIQDRIKQLEEQILEETNDPDRALELRHELQNMREQLSRIEQ